MASLAIVLIVKNEAYGLARCLEKLSWADELIVFDAGSTDNTVEIAKKYTPKVYQDFDWQGFGIQRQRAQEKATADWIFMIDADELMTDQLQSSIQQVVSGNDQTKVYAIPRLSWCFGDFIRYSGWYPDYVTRLYPRVKAGYGDDRVHEKLRFGSELSEQRISGDLLHYTYRDLEHYLVKSAGYAKAWAEQRAERGKTTNLMTGILHGIGCFIKMYFIHVGFLDGRQGFLLALLSAHSTFAKYANLWILTKTIKPDN